MRRLPDDMDRDLGGHPEGTSDDFRTTRDFRTENGDGNVGVIKLIRQPSPSMSVFHFLEGLGGTLEYRGVVGPV